MASEAQAQAGATPEAKPQAESEGKSGALWAIGKLNEISDVITRNFDMSKCPPGTGQFGTLGIMAGLYMALHAIRDGLATASTHGCNGDICGAVMSLIEKDLRRISMLLDTVEDFIKEGKLNTEVKELIAIEETLIIYEVAHYYPAVIDLLARYGRGRI